MRENQVNLVLKTGLNISSTQGKASSEDFWIKTLWLTKSLSFQEVKKKFAENPATDFLKKTHCNAECLLLIYHIWMFLDN